MQDEVGKGRTTRWPRWAIVAGLLPSAAAAILFLAWLRDPGRDWGLLNFPSGTATADEHRPLTAVPLEQFDAAWATDVDIRDQPARAALAELAAAGGWEVGGLEVVPDQPLTFRATGIARLAAIEEVCRQAGVWPEYEIANWTKKVRFKPGPRPQPATVAGPFLIRVTNVAPIGGEVQTQLHVEVLAADLPAAVAHGFEIGLGTPGPEFTGLTTLVGRRPKLASSGRIQNSSLRSDVARQTLTQHLDDVPAHPAPVDFQGLVRVAVPVRVEPLRFDRLTPGTTHTYGAGSITLSEVSRDGMSLVFRGTGLPHDRVAFRYYDRAGRSQFGGGALVRLGDGWWVQHASFAVGDPPAVAVADVAEIEVRSYPFELAGVRLK